MNIMLSRSVFVELMAIYNIKNVNKIDSREGWLAANLGELKKHFSSDPIKQYGAAIWSEVKSEQALIEKKNKYLGLTKRTLFVSYLTASKLACAVGISSMRDWNARHKVFFTAYSLPVPSSPHLAYKDKGWEGWGEFLNTGRTQDYDFLPYKEAKRIVEALGIKTTGQFKEFVNSPLAHPNFPKRPDHVYKDIWVGWMDFLASKFVSYKEAREILKPLKLCSEGDFRALGKSNLRPEGIPSHPYVFYADEFISWAHFLGWEDEIERDNYSSSKSDKLLFG